MKSLAQGLAVLAVAGGIAIGALVMGGGVSRAAGVDAYALVLGALVMVWLVAATHGWSRAPGPSSYERALRRRQSRGPSRPATLERLEREVVMAGGNAFDFHLRLRPRFQAIAAARGLTRGQLGDDAWELLRPDRPPPADRFAPGLPVERQRDLLDRLEELGSERIG